MSVDKWTIMSLNHNTKQLEAGEMGDSGVIAFCDGFLGVVASLALFRSSISRRRRSRQRPQQVQLGFAFD
jgi:hypothetical protein